MKVIVKDWEKVYVPPPSYPSPNIPKLRLRIFLPEYNRDLDVDADWSDDSATLKQNAVVAVKKALKEARDALKGEWTYSFTADSLTKVES